ncbi:MAG: hypothetical protein ABIB71_08900 [Candidatus Woesearchaeota archaeon]
MPTVEEWAMIGLGGVLAGTIGFGIYQGVSSNRRAARIVYSVMEENKNLLNLQSGIEEIAKYYAVKADDGKDEEKLFSVTNRTVQLYTELNDKGAVLPSLEGVSRIIEELDDASENDETLESLGKATDIVVGQLGKYEIKALISLIGNLDDFYDADEDTAIDFAYAVKATAVACKEAECDIKDMGNSLDKLEDSPYAIKFHDLKLYDSLVEEDGDWKDDVPVSYHDDLLPVLIPSFKKGLLEAEKQPVMEEVVAEESYAPIALQQYVENAAYYIGKKVEISAYPVSQSMLDSLGSYALKISDDNYSLDCLDHGLSDNNLLLHNDIEQVIFNNRETVDVKKVTVFGIIKGEDLELDAVEVDGKRRGL